MNDNNEPHNSGEPLNTPPPPPLEQANQTPPPPPVYDHPPATGAGSLVNPAKEERNWAMFAHLSGLIVGLIASATGAPFLGFLGPLVIYLMKKDESPFVADQAKEALNFYITLCIITLVLVILTFTVILMIITIPLMFVVGIAALILSIVAGIKANEGQLYRYPFTLRLIN